MLSQIRKRSASWLLLMLVSATMLASACGGENDPNCTDPEDTECHEN
jgi:hypothetical protein